MRLFVLLFFIFSQSVFALPKGCQVATQTCVEAGGTRLINHIPVTLDCWKKKVTYHCGGKAVNTCNSLINQGCTQVGSNCTDSSCMTYQQTYQCPVKNCATQLVCAQDVFCIDGDCVKQTPTENTNFGQDTSALASVTGGASDYNKNKQVSLFNGKAMDCSVAGLGYDDCCNDSGWGKNIHLASCSDEEKDLGDKKSKYLVTYVGEYCSHKLPIVGTCTAHKRVYCVYDSKMARIVNDYGKDQLHLNNGSAESPNCNGFTIDQFQKINFDLVDFIDPIYIKNNFRDPHTANKKAGIAGDMNVNSPSNSDMEKEVEKRIHDALTNNQTSLKQKARALQSDILAQLRG